MPRHLLTHGNAQTARARTLAVDREQHLGLYFAEPLNGARGSVALGRLRYALFLLVALLAGCGTKTVVETVRADVTQRGETLWQLEALLHDTFGNRPVCASGRWRQNFTAGHCAPLATFAPYGYVFAGAHRSRFHVTSTRARGFGNYPQAVLIRGRNIACDPRERTFLVEYVDSAPFTLGCSRAGWTSR